MYCPACGKLIEDDFVFPTEIQCPHCDHTFYIDLERAYGDMLDDGFAMLDIYNTEAYA